MTMQFDLDADTGWIRRAAVTLEEAGREFRSTPDPGGAPVVGDDVIGRSDQAVATARLINLRCSQAHDAGLQLSAISVGLAGRLRIAAGQLEQTEAGMLPGHR